MDAASSRAAWAVWYAERGWPVHPLRPGLKVPATPHGCKDATVDVERVRRYWARHPDANIGIATGHGVDVIDLDGPDALDALDAAAPRDAAPIDGPIVVTARGAHLYVTPTGRGNRAGLVAGVDYRGAAGYAVAPPSRHPSGHVYYWAPGHGPDLAPASAPGWLVVDVWDRRDRARSGAPPRAVAGVTAATRYAATALDAETGRVACAAVGQRNDTLNAAAFNLGQLVAGGVLDLRDVTGRLLVAATRAGLDQLEAERAIASGMAAGSRTPRKAAA